MVDRVHKGEFDPRFVLDAKESNNLNQGKIWLSSLPRQVTSFR